MLTSFTGLTVVQAVGAKRGLCFGILAGLVIAVKRVDILDKLAVKQVERNALRAYARAFAAVGASAHHVEGTDDVEHILLKGVGSCLLCNAGVGVVKYALLAGAGRADIAAGVAADAAG